MTKWIRILAVCGLSMTRTISATADLLRLSENYSSGFVQLAKLGLPDVTNATYVKVERCWFPPEIKTLLPYDCETTGNAWMIAEERDTKGQPIRGTFVVNGGDVVHLERLRHRYDWQPGSHDPLARPLSPPPPSRAYWGKGSAIQDVKTSLQFLQSLKNDQHHEHQLDAETRGRLFLFAFDLHGRGDTTNAALLVNALLSHSDSTQTVIVDAVNVAGEARLSDIHRQFQSTSDWDAYQKELTTLLVQFPPHWRRHPEVRRLLTLVGKRISDPYSVPAITNGMTVADMNLANRIMGLRAVRRTSDLCYDDAVFWLVPTAWGGTNTFPDDVDMEVRSRGMAGIPFLLTLAHDDALTGVDRATLRRGNDDVLFISHQADPDRHTRLFGMNHRPATRGELATHWLREMVPIAMGRDKSPQLGTDMVEAVRAFYETHNRDSDETLASLFLTDRHRVTNKAVSDFLLRTARRQCVPVIEDFVLRKYNADEDETDGNDTVVRITQVQMNLLMKYAAARGAECRPTVEKFATQLRQQAADYDNRSKHASGLSKGERERAEEIRDHLVRTAAGLEKRPYGMSIEELVYQVTNGQNTEENAHAREVLNAKIETSSPPEFLGTLLGLASATNSPAFRLEIATMARPAAGQYAATGLAPTHYANHWKTLIADDRRGSPTADTLVSDAFLVLNEELFSETSAAARKAPKDDSFFRRLSTKDSPPVALIATYGRRGHEWLRDRVLQRLAGMSENQLPRYPIDEAFSPEQYATLKRKMEQATDPAQVSETMDKLSIYEHAALPGLLRKESDLNKRLTPMAGIITSVTVEGVDESAQMTLTAWKGKTLATDLVRDLRDLCEAQVQAGRTASGILMRNGEFGGCTVSFISRVAIPDSSNKRGGRTATDWRVAGITGLVCAPEVYSAAVWRTVQQPAAQKWDCVETSDPDTVRTFQMAINDLCRSKVAACDKAFVAFQTKGENP